MALARILITLLSTEVFLAGSLHSKEEQTAKREFYELNTAKLHVYWHNALIRSLIKAHCRNLLTQLPYVERVVYELCTNNATTTVALAKCAVQVFNARDFARDRYGGSVQAKRTGRLFTSVPLYRTNSFVVESSERQTIPLYSTDSFVTEKASKQAKASYYKAPLHRLRRRRKSREAAADVTLIRQEVTSNTAGDVLGRTGATDGVRKPRLRPALNVPRTVSKYLRKLLLGSKIASHVDNLRLIHDHFERVDKCNEFFAEMNDGNRRLFDEMNVGIDSRTPQLKNGASSAMQEVLDIVNSFAAETSTDRMSVMSPRLLSLFPEKKSRFGRHRLFSPTMFSFQKDGYFSLPELFDIITSDARYHQLFLDAIMDVSGAGEVLQDLLVQMKSEIEQTKNVKLPLVEELSRKSSRWIRALDTFDSEQRTDYDRKGYAFMNEKQLALIYDRREQDLYGLNITLLGSLSKEEKTARIERDIRALAAFDRQLWPSWKDSKRLRRSIKAREEETNLDEGESQKHEGIAFVTMEPTAFSHLIASAAALEVVTLSPQAFLEEVLYPRALMVETLSPRAFLGAILSPSALIAIILSPTVFRLEVLSPRALQAWVLSPEAFLAEILTPRFLDARVLSPQAMILQVLSPGILSPHFMSSESMSLIILSPNILSPRIESEEKMLIEILSPHILGGSHSHDELHGANETGAHHHNDENSEHGDHEDHDHEHGHEHGGNLPSWIHIVNG